MQPLQAIKKLIDGATAFIGAKIDQAVKNIARELPSIGESVANAIQGEMRDGLDAQSRVLTRFADRLERQVAKLSDPEVSVTFDTSSLASDLKDIANELRDAMPDAPSLKTIEQALTNIYRSVEDGNAQTKQLSKSLADVTTAIKSLKLQTPDTFKLDDMQLRTLRSSGGGVNGGQLAARNVTTKNLSLPDANTEYSYTFPANTVAWTLRIRDDSVQGQYAFASGKLPTSGDGSAYFTLPPYYLQSQPGLDWSSKTIYVQTSGTSQVLEILSYQL